MLLNTFLMVFFEREETTNHLSVPASFMSNALTMQIVVTVSGTHDNEKHSYEALRLFGAFCRKASRLTSLT